VLGGVAATASAPPSETAHYCPRWRARPVWSPQAVVAKAPW